MGKSKSCAPRTTGHAVPSIASRGLLRLSSCALIVFLALSAASCHSTKKLTGQSHSEQSTVLQVDSELMSTIETTASPVRVPMSAVTLTLRMDSLHLLPLGASYTARQGQAGLTVRRKPPADGADPGEVIIEASCDSLELVAMQLSKTVSVLKKRMARERHKNESQLKEQKETTSCSNVQVAFKWLLTGILAGLVLSKIKTIISFIKKRI